MIDLPVSFINFLLILLLFALACAAVLFIFQEKLYSRLSVRITVLILASGTAALIMALAYNEITRYALSTPTERFLQITAVVIGGPVVIGLLAARFVQRPLRQFNNAIASLEHRDLEVQLQPTGIREFDEIFSKFNDLIRRLQHEEKLRKDLVSDTSHELNTPLATMIGQLTAMQEGKHAVTKERVAVLKQQAERLAELVQQLDAYTKARIPDTEEPEDIHLKQFCIQHISHFEAELKQKGIHTTVHIADDLVIRASRDALQKILTNLIQNTLRYSQATEVTIEAGTDSIFFSDNGKGVPAESLPYLFERFYRVDKSRNRETGGLGLGLAIVRELAENQGWTITAAAGHPGLEFVIKLGTQYKQP
jgi:two-component system sensor histidine kinase BaeS